MQSGPQESPLQRPAGHSPTETQPVLPPPGLTQVQPDPQLPCSQTSTPEQVPFARQRLVPPAISRQTQPDPQGLFREHAPAGQVGGGSADTAHVPSRPFPERDVVSWHTVPFSFLLPLHLPCLRFLQGGHDFL